MQQQGNEVDSGVFALAYATSLAFGENPSLYSYNMPLMRKHLVNFLEKKMMYPFLKLDSPREFKIQKDSTVTQYLLLMSFSMPI